MPLLSFVIGLTIFVLALVYFLRSGLNKEAADPTISRPNDKIIIMNGIEKHELKRILVDFCRMYNTVKTCVAAPRMTALEAEGFAITFPGDIDFEIYCYLINYLVYPIDIRSTAKVSGWATTTKADPWMNSLSGDKKVMLFIPVADTEHDVLYLTTQDNIGYKLRFALGGGEELLDEPLQQFIAPSLQPNDLRSRPYEDYC